MVKGVNKQIIEVNNPDSVYFERAVFYLKPGVRTLPVELSAREIDRLIAPYGTNGRRKKTLNAGRIIIYLFIIALTAALIYAFTR